MPLIVLIVLAVVAALVVVALASLWPQADVSAPAVVQAATTAVGEGVARHKRVRQFLARRIDPEVATGLALTVALVLAIGGGLVLGILAYLVRANAQLRHLDNGVAHWGHNHAGAVSTDGLNAITQLGSVWVIVGLAVLVALVESIRAPSRWIVPFLLVALGGEEIITTAVKELANRARPTLNPIAATLGPSFPSGHSATAAVFYAAVALLVARRRRPQWRRLLAGLAAGIAVGVAASRVLLDVHWLSDVVAGLALGWAWFAICSIAFGGRLLRYGAPVEQVVAKADAAVESRTDRRQHAAR